MNFIDALAGSLSKSIRRNYNEAASEKVLFYALSLLINTTLACIIVLIICTLTGHLSEAILVIFFYTFLRFFSGGSHMSSSLSCCIVSIIMFTTLSHIQFSYSYAHIGFAATLIAALIVLKTAPNGIKNISKVDPRYYPLLKLISVLIIVTNFYFQSSILAITFLVQAFQTTQYSYLLVRLIERGKKGV